MFGIVAVLIGGGAVVYTRRSQQQRLADVRAFAERQGWGFREHVDFTSIPDLTRFELFRPGSRRRLANVLTSPPGEPRVVVFDYSYVTSSGKSSQTHRQTVFYATGDALKLPTFSLRPEHFLHRVGAMFGYQDINLERRPVFSEQFLLRGEDETRVRAAFTDTVADFFERRPRVCAAGRGHELLYWRPGRFVPAAELEKLLRDGYDLAARFAATERHM